MGPNIQYAFIGWAVVETKDFSWHASLCDVKMESGDTIYLPSSFFVAARAAAAA